MNIWQTMLNVAVPVLIGRLKGGAQETAAKLAAGEAVPLANITLGPGQHAIVSVAIVSA